MALRLDLATAGAAPRVVLGPARGVPRMDCFMVPCAGAGAVVVAVLWWFRLELGVCLLLAAAVEEPALQSSIESDNQPHEHHTSVARGVRRHVAEP